MENINNTPAASIPATPADNGVRRIPFEPRKWKVTNDGQLSKCAERTMVTDMAGAMTEVLILGNWNHDWGFSASPHFTLKKNTDYVFTFWLNGGENANNNELCQLRIHTNSIYDDKNPYVYKLNRNYLKESKHVAGWYRYDIPFNTGDDGEACETVIKQFQFISQYAYSAFMPHKSTFDDLNDDPLPDPRIPQRHNIKFAGGYPRSAPWSHLVYGEAVTEAPPPPTPKKGRTTSILDLANAGLDPNLLLEGMDSEDICEILREEGLEVLMNAGVDVNALLEEMDSGDKRELFQSMLHGG